MMQMLKLSLQLFGINDLYVKSQGTIFSKIKVNIQRSDLIYKVTHEG
ncbi:hypothetical protein Anacy_1174 [Anabaena cylindrica PCC 7122]|uniref:Uncharacterized protein n=1 Tax=Anabaena cylindrica (strain ATCC 27899 / PCC 7122) TaxID=272123 RepID=K9ZC43_ANACC|nr:hypothetical protein Anacy_1174 [Anabaena cylindrica PCC 7122]BAY00803.1 hypothetical protein NIES19_00290 [Anabaena cylindrica PCC 7122]